MPRITARQLLEKARLLSEDGYWVQVQHQTGTGYNIISGLRQKDGTFEKCNEAAYLTAKECDMWLDGWGAAMLYRPNR